MLKKLPLLLGGLMLLLSPTFAQKYQEMIDLGTFKFEDIQREANRYFEKHGTGKGSGYKQYKRWEYVAEKELDENGFIISDEENSQRTRNYKRSLETNGRFPTPSTTTGNWQELGPTYWVATSGWNPGVGRCTDVSVDPNNSQHWIVGTPGGSLWRTYNGGTNWTVLTDNFSTIDVWAVAISPANSNTYIWGGNSQIYKSTDAGVTWTTTTKPSTSGRITRIVYHPTDFNIVFAITQTSGLLRSTNGGDSWTLISGTSGGSCWDIAFKPGDPNTVYYTSNTVRKSTNGGLNFTEITGFATASNNHKKVAVSANNPEVVYVLESNGGVFGGFYRSTNSGDSFTKLIDGATINFFGYDDKGADDRGQAPRDMAIACSPSNANEVHIGGIHTWRSTNGGTSFQLSSFWTPSGAQQRGVGYNHADIDNLRYYGNTLFALTDGGIYTSTDGGVTFVDKTTGMGIREFYKIGVSKTDPNLVSGGSQDNGTSVMRGANREWRCWLGADGMESFVDWANPNNLYGTSQNGTMYRSTNMGNGRNGITGPGGTGAWVTPFEQDPLVAATIYVAYADVFKSTDRGATWTAISSNLGTGNVSNMKIAPTNNQIIYVSKGTNLYVTTNGGTSWTTLNNGWNSEGISYITIHPRDPNKVVLVTSSRVYRTDNAGASWTNITGNLPSSTKYCATWEDNEKDGLYVGGLGYVMYREEGMNNWTNFMSGLPNVRVYELEINYVSKKIFAGTYGRGLWESDVYNSGGPVLNPPVAAFTADVNAACGAFTVNFKDESTNNPTAWSWTFPGGTPATSNIQNPTVQYSNPGTYNVSLTATNADGSTIAQKGNFIKIVQPNAGSVQDVKLCAPGLAAFQVTGASGTVLWYEDSLSTNLLNAGSGYSTQVAGNENFFYTVSESVNKIQKLGPELVVANGTMHAGNFFNIINVERPFTLKSFIANANGAKIRTVVLRDANGTILQQKDVNIPDGISRVELNLNIPVGQGLQIGMASGADVFRSNVGLNFPYTMDGLSIVGSSASNPTGFFYYLYDWEVERNDFCYSVRKEVKAEINDAGTPVYEDVTVCNLGDVTLSATSSNNNTILWYDNATDSIPAFVGNIYETNIQNPKSFYVSSSTSIGTQKIGMNSIIPADGAYHNGGFFMVFDAPKPVLLKSALVLSEEAKNRTIVIRNANGVVIASKQVFIPAGESRVIFDLTIPQGNNLQIGFSDSNLKLYRTNVGVSYPYSAGGLMTIKTTTVVDQNIANNFYYYLYDMEIMDTDYCESVKAEVVVNVDICTGTDVVSQSKLIEIYPNPTQNQVTVKNKEAKKLQLFDVQGKLLQTVNINNSNQIVNLNSYAPGTYYVQVTLSNDKIVSERVIKL